MKNRTVNEPEKPLSGKIFDTLLGYIKTQVVIMVIIAGITWGLLTFLGVQYALLLSVLSGALSSVPILGMTTAAIITGIVAIFDNQRFLSGLPVIIEGIVIFAMYFLLNQVIDFLIAPYLIGKTTKIHPLFLLLSVLIGSALFGIAGAFLAVPIILVLKTVQEHFENNPEHGKRKTLPR